MTDTQAPDAIWAVRTGIEGAVEIGAWADTVRHHGGTEYERRDLADARAAAAAQAMREAAAKVLRTEAEACRELKTSFRQSDVSLETVGNWLDEYSKQVRAIPLPDTAALDRLIAERVREAFEEAAKIVREEERRAKWDAQHQGHDTATRAKASAAWSALGVAAQMIEERARGSKEGQS